MGGGLRPINNACRCRFSAISREPRALLLDGRAGRAHAAGFIVQMILLAGAFWLALAVRFDFAAGGAAGASTRGAGPWVTEYFLPLLPVLLGIKLLVGWAGAASGGGSVAVYQSGGCGAVARRGGDRFGAGDRRI